MTDNPSTPGAEPTDPTPEVELTAPAEPAVEAESSTAALAEDTVEGAAAQPTAEASVTDFVVEEPEAAPEADVNSAEPVAEEAPDEEPVAQEAPDEEPVAQASEAQAPPPAAAPAAPSPKMFAARPKPPAASVVQAHTPSDSARFGRVGEDGTVYVRDGEGERAVGSYPGAGADDALQYFARKYDELYAAADLLHQRAGLPEVTSKDLAEGLSGLRTHIGEANVVGDLAALNTLVEGVESQISVRRETESAARAAARAEALTVREGLVSEAEAIAAQPLEKVQWKTSSATMRSLLDSWKEQQRSGARLDKESEAALWQRFSKARNSFDKARRSHFAEVEATRGAAKGAKEKLVAEAEKLSTSTDWAPTAGAFKRLMDQWRVAGRASRSEDDALWARFKAAQDSFFAAKDQVVAAEDEEFRKNLDVKLGLLAEAEKLLPVTNLESAKSALRGIQDRWEAAGKVPRADIERTEKGLRRIEAAIREAEDKKWRRTNPEVTARAQSLATQLEASVAKLETDLADAQAKGNAKKIADVQAKLDAQRAWLDQARGGLAEFG
ncbi:DUF349 domain-containing protein [Nostocoides veronense]|uniref:DUF349 domain-containing protein n=1 Tax=Nostocoides veronense TaxID=330836 RepID=A0ABN2LFM7_9MICO